MNPLTVQLLATLWEGTPSFRVVAERLQSECVSMSAAEAGVIGRDLLLRRRALYTKLFHLAAFLVSDGVAGNDGFTDFTDCVAFLPEERYQRILTNPDTLIDDPVSSEFDELYLTREVTDVFDHALARDSDSGLLDYLVFGDSGVNWDELHSWTVEDAKTRLPNLFAKYEHLLVRKTSVATSASFTGNTATLEDLIP